jgi:hypothetical protein
MVAQPAEQRVDDRREDGGEQDRVEERPDDPERQVERPDEQDEEHDLAGVLEGRFVPLSGHGESLHRAGDSVEIPGRRPSATEPSGR